MNRKLHYFFCQQTYIYPTHFPNNPSHVVNSKSLIHYFVLNNKQKQTAIPEIVVPFINDKILLKYTQHNQNPRKLIANTPQKKKFPKIQTNFMITK
eukprot:TRINITY_DN15875_c0_g1_i1.p1 TRINITY_DN15875_c0_g1~~TRINITY_DN15875_c0_g1_i1.p1  ORF type:complete len:108 (+),score=1.30 TRINITY_DN15875_c0_g1_i1:38-325(+)